MLLPLLFATCMALGDVLVLCGIKAAKCGMYNLSTVLPVGMLLYAFQPLLFSLSLNYATMTVMNMLWDVISDVLVTMAGLFYFKENLSPTKFAGLACALSAVVLLNI